MLADPKVDIVYIASPMACHYNDALAALKAGKHVLCEKTVTMCTDDWIQLTKIAKEKHLFLMEAMWMKCRPTFQQALSWAKEGKIGTVKLVKADFCNIVPFIPQSRLFRSDLGGGALLDLGVYPFTLAEAFLEGEVQHIDSTAYIGETLVDYDMGALITYPNGTAILSAGYGVGARKFSDTLSRQGAKLDPDPDKHREMAFNAHAIYRASHPNIVKFWDLCSRVIKDMEAGYSGRFGGPTGDVFEFGTKEMGSCGRKVPYVLLPNGYHLWYPGLRVENDEGKAQYYYDRPRGKNMVKTKIYGGSLCENITQGFAFAVLSWQACRMHEAGIKLAANIHDSFAAVVPVEQAEEVGQLMYRIMTTCPPWASTLPLFAEVELGDDFGVV